MFMDHFIAYVQFPYLFNIVLDSLRLVFYGIHLYCKNNMYCNNLGYSWLCETIIVYLATHVLVIKFPNRTKRFICSGKEIVLRDFKKLKDNLILTYVLARV